QAGVGVDGLRARDRQQLAAPFVQLDAQAEERLEPAAEAAARAPDALRDRADAPASGRIQVQDAIGLAVADRAQHDRLRLDSTHGHDRMFVDRSDSSSAGYGETKGTGWPEGADARTSQPSKRKPG